MDIRKQIRLKDYDYSQNGSYFVTICTKNRECILSEISNVGVGFHAHPRIVLSDIGNEIDLSIKFINDIYDCIDKYVIMPNHIHLIVNFHSDRHGNLSLQDIIYKLKSFTTHKYNQMNNCKHKVIWQRSFHDHIIRTQRSYDEIWSYIDTNPLRWHEDIYYTK